MNNSLNKQGQLFVIIAGFFTTVYFLLTQSAPDPELFTRGLITLIFALACTARYWWVILLLDWPFRVARMLLLLLAWCALPMAALNVRDAHVWAVSLAGFSAIGALTEIYNGLTGQWRKGSEAMTQSLKYDHMIGSIAATIVFIVLVIVAQRCMPRTIEWLVGAIVAGDWIRLILMIRRHKSFLKSLEAE